MRGRAVLVGALFVGFGVAASGRAQPVALDYAAAAGCPDEAWLSAEVAARLGRDPFVDAVPTSHEPGERREPRVVARVASERNARGWRGSLELLSDDSEGDGQTLRALGRRELEDDDCRELTAALALSLAMTLDTILGEQSANASPSETPSDTSTTQGAASAPRELVLRFEVDERGDAAPNASELHDTLARSLHVVARGGITIGLRPDLAPRVELGLVLRRGRSGRPRTDATPRTIPLRPVLELGGAFGPPTRGDVAGRSLRTRDGELHVAPCLRAFEVWDVCGIASLGRLAVVADDRSPRAWTASIGLRTEAAWSIVPSVALTFALDLRANLRRPSVISGDETLWRAAPVRGAVVLGLRWRFAEWTESRARTQAASSIGDAHPRGPMASETMASETMASRAVASRARAASRAGSATSRTRLPPREGRTPALRFEPTAGAPWTTRSGT